MKKLLGVLITGLVLASVNSGDAAVLARWTFETSPPADLTDVATIGPLAADAGSGTASGFHADPDTDWSTPGGNGSANSLSANNWAVGDYFQFQVSTIGYSDITLSWDQTGTSTGPRDFVLQYSTDGTIFTTFGSTYAVLLNNAPAWSNVTPHDEYTFTHDLSGIMALDNNTTVYFRLVVDSSMSIGGGTVVGTGNNRVDNFTINAVPEPTTWAGIIFGAFFCGVQVVRRWRAVRGQPSAQA